MRIELKIWPIYFQAVADRMKQFEIREKRDRDLSVGSVLVLREWEPSTGRYTGRSCERLVTYITDFAQKPGFVVMSLAEL